MKQLQSLFRWPKQNAVASLIAGSIHGPDEDLDWFLETSGRRYL